MSTGKYSKAKQKRKRKLNMKRIGLLFLFIIVIFFFLNQNKEEQNKEVIQASANQIQEDIKEEVYTTVKMTVVGDIMCHDTQFKDAYNSSTDTYDFSHVFREVKEHFTNSDLVIGNLETTFAGKQRGYSGYPTFNTPESLGQNLKTLGFDILSTANNHSLDKGYSGLVSTLEELEKLGIETVGTYSSVEDSEKILTKEVNGIKFAFLSYTYGTNGIPVPNRKRILHQLN